MTLVLLKNRIYNHEDVDMIIHGLKHNKNAAQLASPLEHKIYKHQYEILEQYMNQGSQNRNLNWDRDQGDEGNDLDLFTYSTPENESDANKNYLGGVQVRIRETALNAKLHHGTIVSNLYPFTIGKR